MSRRHLNNIGAETLLTSTETHLNAWHILFIQFSPHAVRLHAAVPAQIKSRGTPRQLWRRWPTCRQMLLFYFCFFFVVLSPRSRFCSSVIKTSSNRCCSSRLMVLNTTGILELRRTHGWHSHSVLMPFPPSPECISLAPPPLCDTHWHFSDWEFQIPNSWHLCHTGHVLPLHLNVWLTYEFKVTSFLQLGVTLWNIPNFFWEAENVHVEIVHWARWLWNKQHHSCMMEVLQTKSCLLFCPCPPSGCHFPPLFLFFPSSFPPLYLLFPSSFPLSLLFPSSFPLIFPSFPRLSLFFSFVLPSPSSFIPVWFWLVRCCQRWQVQQQERPTGLNAKLLACSGIPLQPHSPLENFSRAPCLRERTLR